MLCIGCIQKTLIVKEKIRCKITEVSESPGVGFTKALKQALTNAYIFPQSLETQSTKTAQL